MPRCLARLLLKDHAKVPQMQAASSSSLVLKSAIPGFAFAAPIFFTFLLAGDLQRLPAARNGATHIPGDSSQLERDTAGVSTPARGAD